MYRITASNKFLKDLTLLKKRSNRDFVVLKDFIEILANEGHKGLNQNTNRINYRVNLSDIGNAM